MEEVKPGRSRRESESAVCDPDSGLPSASEDMSVSLSFLPVSPGPGSGRGVELDWNWAGSPGWPLGRKEGNFSREMPT